MGRPGCEQCCGKPEPAQCLSCLHACQYAEVNDPALLDKYWSGRVYQPTGFTGDPADLFGGGYAFGYNASRTYANFDPETHPCNEDKFEYIVHVISCQDSFCVPNGDFDVCVNGENLGTYIGYDPLNSQDIPLFEGLPLFPYKSKHNEQRKCGPAQYKGTIFGTSQEAIDHVVDTNFGTGWLRMGGFGDRELIPPAERRTLADYNTFVVPKDPFLMDARDIIIDQNGNPSFGPKAGSFDVKLIPNPGINNLRLDIAPDVEGRIDVQDYVANCAIPMGTVDPSVLSGAGVSAGTLSYPIQWTPPSKIQIIIYSLERPVGNDNAAVFRVCTIASVCLCASSGEEVCDNIGLRPLCVNPFDSDNYENGQPKFISSADFNSSTECSCNDDGEYGEPESPGDRNAAPTCYYEADMSISSPDMRIENVYADGDWKSKTREIMQAFVDSAQDSDDSFLPRGSAVRIAEAMQDMLEDLLASTAGCPKRLAGNGYAGPFAVSPLAPAYILKRFIFSASTTTNVDSEDDSSGDSAGTTPDVPEGSSGSPTGGMMDVPEDPFGSPTSGGGSSNFGSSAGSSTSSSSSTQSSSPNFSEAYVPISVSFSYRPQALSDALASDIMNPNTNTLEFNGTCCAKWGGKGFGSAPQLRTAGGEVRGQRASFINIGDTWSTNLGRLLNMNPGDVTTGWNISVCEEALDVANGDAMPLYLDLGSALNASAPYLDSSAGTSRSSLGRHDKVEQSGYVTYIGFGVTRNELRTIFPFEGQLDSVDVVYTFNNISNAQYYYNVDAQCGGIGCIAPQLPEGKHPCEACLTNIIGFEVNFFSSTTAYNICDCAADTGNPCHPFAADPHQCPEITNGSEERQIDHRGNVYCNILCDPGYVLEYDDVTGCSQCVEIQCQGSCNFSWTGNSWNFFPIGSTCPCKCEPPNIPGTFVGEIGQGTCVDDIAAKKCAKGKCWWTWFVLVGGGGEWRKNAADDPFGFSSTCECNCDPPPNDGLFAGDQTATLCFE